MLTAPAAVCRPGTEIAVLVGTLGQLTQQGVIRLFLGAVGANPGRVQTSACQHADCTCCCVQAWDTLFWFAVLVGMSGQLTQQGVIRLFSDAVGGKLAAWNLGWQGVFAILNVAYFGLHYVFASQTAHVSALYAAFLGMMLAAGVLLCNSQHRAMSGLDGSLPMPPQSCIAALCYLGVQVKAGASCPSLQASAAVAGMQELLCMLDISMAMRAAP